MRVSLSGYVETFVRGKMREVQLLALLAAWQGRQRQLQAKQVLSRWRKAGMTG